MDMVGAAMEAAVIIMAGAVAVTTDGTGAIIMVGVIITATGGNFPAQERSHRIRDFSL